MTLARKPLRFILLAIAGACAIVGAARAQVLTPRQLIPAIDAVVDRKLELRAELLACAGSDAFVRDTLPKTWTDFRRTLTALLWAADFPADFVRAITRRTDPAALAQPAAKDAAACKDPEFVNKSIALKPDGWGAEMRFMFKGLQLPSTVTPPTDEQWSRVKASASREGPAQAKLLNCVALVDPNLLGVAMSDWARALGDGQVMLDAAGFPRDEVLALLEPLAPNALLKPLPADRAAARAVCLKEQDWQQRYALFQTTALFFDIREIVTGKR